MNGPRILSATVDPPAPPTAVETLAMAMAREQALEITDDRRAVLRSCAFEVERKHGRVWWPGVGGAARVCSSEMEIDSNGVLVGYDLSSVRDDGYGVMPVCWILPYATNDGATAAFTSVEKWSEETDAYADTEYTLLPAGRLRVEEPGTYRVIASLTAPDDAPVVAVEGLRRYFGERERRRPAEKSGGGGEIEVQGTQAGSLRRSGGEETLSALRVRVVV